jgi:hypothetical protein
MKTYLKQNGMRLAFAAALLAGLALGLIEPANAMLGMFILSFETVAGATLAVTAVVPMTYDAAGYGASGMNYINIGEITDLGSGYGRTYNTVSHAPIASAQVTEKKGGFKLGQVKLMMAWDQNDAGQDLLRISANDNSILTFMLTKQSGDKRYFQAQVSQFEENFGTVDNVVVGAVTLLLQRDVVDFPL